MDQDYSKMSNYFLSSQLNALVGTYLVERRFDRKEGQIYVYTRPYRCLVIKLLVYRRISILAMCHAS